MKPHCDKIQFKKQEDTRVKRLSCCLYVCMHLCSLAQCVLCVGLFRAVRVDSELQCVQLVGLFLDQCLCLLLSVQSLTELLTHTVEPLSWDLHTQT